MQIKISNLSKQYGKDKLALDNVNLQINSGMFGLLGPNGAGKTTLIRILVTLLEPTKGQVKINDLDLMKNRSQIRNMLGYLPQGFSLFSRLKTWEFLDYIASLAGIKKRSQRHQKVDELLELVGLYEARERRANKLSGGMKRRLGIAQTLISDPKVMIVDEPTVGLDPEERLRFRNILADLSSQDMIIILSTHIVGDISSSCQDMALLDNGKIIYNNSPEQLIESANGHVWIVSASNLELDKLKEKYPVVSIVPSREGYEVRLVGDYQGSLTAKKAEPNLEDAYIFFMQNSLDETDSLVESGSW